MVCLFPAEVLHAGQRGTYDNAKNRQVSITFHFKKSKDGTAVLVSQDLVFPDNGSSGINGDGVNLETLVKRTNYFANNVNRFVLLGAAGNTGTSAAVYVEANATFYGNNSSVLGTDSEMLRGGSNVKLDDNSFANALLPGDTGYFRLDSELDFSSVVSWDLAYTYTPKSDSQYSRTMADPVFTSGPDFSSTSGGKLQVAGQVKNPSSSQLTYWNDIYFFIFDSSGKLVDLQSAIVSGSDYNYGSGTTDTALQPGETGTFSRTFYQTDYTAYFGYDTGFQYYVAEGSGGSEEKDPPFGSFDTPIDQSTVSSSIPVTGWALDDSEVQHVKIYRQANGSLVYIGDASFVKGARPDVQQSFPDYPGNDRAGWGYMMLTNFLPNGDGKYTLEAIATDGSGKTTSLGTKTIYVDNTNAVKPFGAIDTPLQGGTAYGNNFINWGWVLTPQPDSIPKDGSSIDVHVNGVNLGHPIYNIYRQDIDDLFHGYENSDGAVGYFYFDTTGYADGVHTIQWTARDTGNDSDGIGSRYFTINNPRIANRTNSQSYSLPVPKINIPNVKDIMAVQVDDGAVISYREGFDDQMELKPADTHQTGIISLKMPESGRLVVQLNNRKTSGESYQGYLLVNGKLSSLPTGSTLDSHSGTFYWMPGPVFRGRFPLVFVKTSASGYQKRLTVIISIY